MFMKKYKILGQKRLAARCQSAATFCHASDAAKTTYINTNKTRTLMRKTLNYSFSFNLELNRFTVVLKISCRILEIIQL